MRRMGRIGRIGRIAGVVVALAGMSWGGTLAYWRFEEGTNGMRAPLYWSSGGHKWYVDSAGNNRCATLAWWTSPAYTNRVPGAVVPKLGLANNLAIWCGGGDPPNLDDDIWSEGAGINTNTALTNAWTVEAAIMTYDTGKWQVYVGKDGKPSGSSPFPPFALKHNAAHNRLELLFMDAQLNERSVLSTRRITAGRWYWVAAVCDGSEARLYMREVGVDPYYVLEGSVSGVRGGMAWMNTPWTVGRGQWNGANADWVNGVIDEVRISDGALGMSEFLGSGNGVVGGSTPWSVEVASGMLAGNARVAVGAAAGYVHVLARPEGANQPVYYFRGSNSAEEELFESRSLGNPYNPNDGERAFDIKAGTDGRMRVVISGPGGTPADDHVLFGTETAVGSGTFTWEEVTNSWNWANQIGFALDQNNKAYIALKDQGTGQCVVYNNVGGSWQAARFGTIDPNYPRLLAAVDYNNHAWVVFNARGGGSNYVAVWSNRSGSWSFEFNLTNAPQGNYAGCYFVQSAGGFEFDNEGYGWVALKPDWWSGNLELWMFGPIPEPVGVWGVLGMWVIWRGLAVKGGGKSLCRTVSAAGAALVVRFNQ